MSPPFVRRFVVLLFLLVTASIVAQKPDEVASEIHEKVNAYRVKKDVKKLTLDSKLSAVAQAHAQGMADADRFGDDNKNGHIWDGKGPLERMVAVKYAYQRLGENVHFNTRTRSPGEAAVKGWIASKGHEENMRRTEYTHTGIGVAQSKSGRWYSVQLLALPRETEKDEAVVILENRTKHKIMVQFGARFYEAPIGRKSVFWFTPDKETKATITWPASGDAKERVEQVILVDQASYTLSEQKPGTFAFEKVVAKKR